MVPLLRRSLRGLLIGLAIWTSLTAVPGGIALMLGIYTPPVALLKGSPFHSYAIPGLSLLLLVGGSALAAAYLLIKKHPLSLVVTGISGLILMTFEFLEVLFVATPPGPGRVMQLFYFADGLILAGGALLLTVSLSALDAPSNGNQNPDHPGDDKGNQ